MRVRLPDVELNVWTAGQGAPVLFIHGFPISGEMWRATVERLMAAGSVGWRYVVPDLRGHGGSGVSENVTIAQFADDLVGVLDALDERQPAVIVGLSMGGMIAFELYRRHRARARALVLCDTRAEAETPAGRERRENMAQLALAQGSAAVVETMIGGVFGPQFPAEQREHWRALMARTPAKGAAAAARAMAGRAESFVTLPTIDCPTLVVVGDQDTFTPPEQMKAIADGIRGARFEVIAGAGHVPPVEQPEAFAQVLGGFLASFG